MAVGPGYDAQWIYSPHRNGHFESESAWGWTAAGPGGEACPGLIECHLGGRDVGGGEWVRGGGGGQLHGVGQYHQRLYLPDWHVIRSTPAHVLEYNVLCTWRLAGDLAAVGG